jgi:hypothetical protein|tara:strand:+ start:1493 stop:1684 length:192 start_codon:yes stop_codon:yes gene_type:complete
MQEIINLFFNICVYILQVTGNVTGMGYQLANIVIFVFLQPALILLFFVLWRKERNKHEQKLTG